MVHLPNNIWPRRRQCRAVRVHPYPWVYPYPARTRGYGPGRVQILRVRVGHGYRATGTGKTGFTRYNQSYSVTMGHTYDNTITIADDADPSHMLTPLQFWKNQAKGLPKLSMVARSVFAIPATQNKSERAFSSAGNVLTDLRTSLDPEHVDELLLIRSHYKQGHDSLSKDGEEINAE